MKRSCLALIVAGMTVAACSPPHQVDSDKRVDTATSFSAVAPKAAPTTSEPVDPTLPAVIECVSPPTTKPHTLSLACADDNDRLVDITWTSWTATEAVGSATRETNNCLPNCADGTIESTKDVKVHLGNPISTPQGLTFTQLTVAGEVIPL